MQECRTGAAVSTLKTVYLESGPWTVSSVMYFCTFVQRIIDLLSVHCTKKIAIFLSPAGMSLTKQNYSCPRRVWLVTSRLGSGKSLSFFTVYKAAVFGFVRCTYIVIVAYRIYARAQLLTQFRVIIWTMFVSKYFNLPNF